MGQIHIKVIGSFPEPSVFYESATEGGHAAALGRAIEKLTALLPAAIVKDHNLHDAGTRPPLTDFGKRKIPEPPES